MSPSADEKTLSNVELRGMDGTCNPYIVLTALAKAGMLGMPTKTRLPQPVNKDTKSEVRAAVPCSPAAACSLTTSLAFQPLLSLPG